jgi:hypothetical protein
LVDAKTRQHFDSYPGMEWELISNRSNCGITASKLWILLGSMSAFTLLGVKRLDRRLRYAIMLGMAAYIIWMRLVMILRVPSPNLSNAFTSGLKEFDPIPR